MLPLRCYFVEVPADSAEKLGKPNVLRDYNDAEVFIAAADPPLMKRHEMARLHSGKPMKRCLLRLNVSIDLLPVRIIVGNCCVDLVVGQVAQRTSDLDQVTPIDVKVLHDDGPHRSSGPRDDWLTTLYSRHLFNVLLVPFHP